MAAYTVGVLILEATTTDKAEPRPRKAYTSDNEMQELFKEALYISNNKQTNF